MYSILVLSATLTGSIPAQCPSGLCPPYPGTAGGTYSQPAMPYSMPQTQSGGCNGGGFLVSPPAVRSEEAYGYQPDAEGGDTYSTQYVPQGYGFFQQPRTLSFSYTRPGPLGRPRTITGSISRFPSFGYPAYGGFYPQQPLMLSPSFYGVPRSYGYPGPVYSPFCPGGVCR